MNPTSPPRTPAELKAIEQQSRELIAPWWLLADRIPHYPVTTAEACELLRVVGFDASPAVVREFFRKRYLQEPARRGGPTSDWKWSAAEIRLLATALECRRRWLPGHPNHEHKLWWVELKQEECRRQGIEFMHDAPTLTIEDLALMLAAENDASVRQVLCAALKLKLPVEFGPTAQDRQD